MTCQELVELVTDYFDGALSPADRDEFERHLAICPGCVNYIEQMRTTIRLAQETKALEQRPEVGALLHAFREWKASPG
jgi:anti-sigma factor RsiW